MRGKAKGFAMVLALAVMAILVGVIAALAVSTIGELRQTRASVQLLTARAAAEAGETYARYVLRSAAQPDFRNVFLPYATAFLASGGDPASEWVVPEDEWDDVAGQLENLLNANYGVLPADALTTNDNVRLSYRVQGFRGVVRTNSAQTYLADYTVLATAEVHGARRRVEDRGYLQIQIGRPSLSQWLFLVDDAGGWNGFFPTGTVFNGPVHANENWGFWGQPIFTDVASTAADGAVFWSLSGDGCSGAQKVWIQGDSRPPCTVPIFQKGFVRNAPYIRLPTSAVSQERAALGLDPIQDADADGEPDPVSPAERCQALFGTSSCTVPNGVYLVHDGSQVTGGIYVEGDLDRLTLEASGDGKQIYRLEQNGATWTIEVDYTANTTTITDPLGNPTTYTGVPNGPAPLGSGGPTGQIYVNGAIEAMAGPGRNGPLPCGTDYPGSADNCPDHPPPEEIRPALSLETQLNVTARGEIGIVGDLIYECDPTKLGDAAYLADHPRCDLGGAKLPTVLGVMSETEDIVLRDGVNPYVDRAPDNIYLWGSYLAGTANRGLAVENYNTRGPQGKMRLFGGLIQSADQLRGTITSDGNLLSGFIETYDYDVRFANSALAPPNFPTARFFDVQNLIPVPLSYKEF